MTSIVEIPEAVAHRWCITTLKISEKLTGQQPCLTSLIIKLQLSSLQKYSKLIPAQVLFCEFCTNCLNTLVLHTTSNRLDWRLTEEQRYYPLSILSVTSRNKVFQNFVSSTLKCLPSSQFRYPSKLHEKPQLLWHPSSHYDTLNFIQFHGDGSNPLNSLLNLFNFLRVHCSELFLSLIGEKASLDISLLTVSIHMPHSSTTLEPLITCLRLF